VDTVKLQKLLMKEVSGVDDPASQLPGWMIAKSRAPAPAEKLHMLDANGSTAVAHDNVDTVTVYKSDGTVVQIAKSSLDESAVVERSSSDAPTAEHHSERQNRHPATGRFQGGIWRHVSPPARDARNVFLT